jgi:hypothetical protein
MRVQLLLRNWFERHAVKGPKATESEN